MNIKEIIKRLNLKDRRVVLLISGVLVLFIVITSIALINRNSYSSQLKQRTEDLIRNREVLDSAIEGEANYKVAENIKIDNEINRMPKLVLLPAEHAWFTNEIMQLLAFHLGFNDKATFTKLGKKAIWMQGSNKLTIDPELGTLEFDVLLNKSTKLPIDKKPTEEILKNSLNKFFDDTKIIKSYYNLDNIDFTRFNLDNNGNIDSSFTDNFTLLKGTIPYVVSGVEIILPVDSFAIVDGEGRFIKLSLLIPNIKQDEGNYSIVNYRNAIDDLEKGVGVVLEAKESIPGELAVDNVVLNYYLSIEDFYSIGTKRLLNPVYVFSGEKGKVGVLATRK